MVDWVLWATVLSAGVGTYLIRLSFLAVFERYETVPPRLGRALGYVPAAVLAALVVPSLVLGGGETGTLEFTPLRLLAGVLAALVAWRTGSVLWTIVLGMVALVFLEALVGSVV